MKVVTEEMYIPAKTYTITRYIASDGQEFSTEVACLGHEQYLDTINHPVFKSKIEKVGTFDDEPRGVLYYLRNKEDYDFLIKHTPILPKDMVNDDFEEYGEGWYLFWSESGGDYRDCYNIYNYDAYEKEIENNWEQYKETMHSLMAHKSTIL